MAKGEMDDFLKKYYRILHAGKMDYDVRARLVDNKKKGLLTPEQESWFTDGFFVEDADDSLGYSAAPELSLGNKVELHDNELRKLYKRVAKAMYGMKSASGLYPAKYSDVKKFINQYVDDLKLFPIPKATDECKNAISVLLNLLENHPNKEEIKARIVRTAKTIDNEGKEKLVFSGANPVGALNKFIEEKIKTGKYDEDTNVQNKLKAIANGLYDDWRYSYNPDVVTTAIAPITSSLSTISQESSFEIQDKDIDSNYKDKLNDFEAGYGSDILRKVFYDEDIRNKFAEKDPELVEIITKAEGKLSYQDPNSSEYLSPKSDDVLTPLQQVEKWATDTYNNSIRKYMRLRGDPLLFSGFSKEIFKAIDKEKIKPTDGLDGLLGKTDAIKKRIPNKTVMEHFDWFVATMNDIKNRKPKAVAGAWNNARQMKTVITEIILKASGPGSTNEDMEKAKTAMEIMTAMKYGMMTSKVMDAMRQTDFTIFSDKDLSWNKNDGIKFVTAAFDQSIKAAFLGIGYGVTFVRNKIMMSGMKFNDKTNKNEALAKNIAWEKDNLAKKQKIEPAAINAAITNAEQKRKDNEQILTNAGFDKDDPDANEIKKKDLDTEKDRVEKLLEPHRKKMEDASERKADSQKKQDTYVEQMNTYEQAKDEYEHAEKIINGDDIKEQEAQADAIKNQVSKLQQTLNKPLVDIDGNLITDPVQEQKMREQLAQQIADLTAQYNDKLYEIDNLKNDPNRIPNATKARDAAKDGYDGWTRAQNDYQSAEKDYQNAENDYQSAKQQYENVANANNYKDTTDKIAQYEDATKAIKEANDTIQKKQEELAKWPKENVNKVKELEDFWNFLQTGKAKTYRLFTDRAQKKFDIEKQQLLQDFVSQHGLDI